MLSLNSTLNTALDSARDERSECIIRGDSVDNFCLLLFPTSLSFCLSKHYYADRTCLTIFPRSGLCYSRSFPMLLKKLISDSNHQTPLPTFTEVHVGSTTSGLCGGSCYWWGGRGMQWQITQDRKFKVKPTKSCTQWSAEIFNNLPC